jgi:hypothetical protein
MTGHVCTSKKKSAQQQSVDTQLVSETEDFTAQEIKAEIDRQIGLELDRAARLGEAIEKMGS